MPTVGRPDQRRALASFQGKTTGAHTEINQYRPRINAQRKPYLVADHATDQPCYSKQAGVSVRIIVVAMPTHDGLATAGSVIVIDLHFESDDVVGGP